MTENKKRTRIIACVLFALSFLLAAVSYFLLPEKIFVQIINAGSVPETNTLLFLIAGVLLNGLAGVMTEISDAPKKYLALQAVLVIAFVGCIAYNFTLL